MPEHIEFLEASHTYLVEGVIVPSVTTILGATLFKDKYKGIPAYILKNKADFGVNVHKAIELDSDEGLTQVEKISYDQWKKLEKQYNIVPLELEQKVNYGYKFAGTFDMVISFTDSMELVLNDIKTTAKLDEEYLSWQLSFYREAYKYRFGTDIQRGYVTWLPKKDLGQFIEIPLKSSEEVMELVKIYEQANT